MLPSLAGALTPLSGVKLSGAALPKYRELLRSTRRRGSEEDSGSLFQQAKERVLVRLQERRQRARHDPRRAFSRLQERWAAARSSLREIKDEQKARLRQYYASAVVGGSRVAAAEGAAAGGESPAVAGVLAEGGALSAAEMERAAAVLGSNGPLRHLVLAGVGGACKLFLTAGARTAIEGQERMAAALNREAGRGLITVSNHVGAVDDPLITSSIVPADKLLEPRALRWTMCATDRCFKSQLLAPFFRAAKVLPVERGAGLNQFGMQLAQSRLAAGDWVHIFPEGTRSRDGRMLPVRKGVGWLVASAAASGAPPPLVLPFVHSGMERVMPKGRALPKLGQELRILVGEPVPVDDLLATADDEGWGEQRLHVAIADRVGQALYTLKAQLDGLPLETVAPQARAAQLSINEDTLLPLIEDEMDSLAHRWHDRWQRTGLPSLTQRLRHKAAARRAALTARLAALGEGEGGGPLGLAAGGSSDTSFEAFAAATEETAGVISSWEHASAAPAPWALDAGAAEDAAVPWEAAAAAPAGPMDAAAAVKEPALLACLKLRVLRGSGPHAAVGGSTSLAAEAPSTLATTGRLDFVAASPLDAARTAAGSSGTLASLLSATAGYSAERVRYMQHLLAA